MQCRGLSTFILIIQQAFFVLVLIVNSFYAISITIVSIVHEDGYLAVNRTRCRR